MRYRCCASQGALASGLLLLAACESGQRATPAVSMPAQPGSLPTRQMQPIPEDVPLLKFGRYRVTYDEGYASVAYKPQPGSDWVAIPQVTGRDVTLDTANIDQTGEPELLLTVAYKRAGNPDEGTVRTLHVLRTGRTIASLLTMRVGCSDYHHSWENGELSSFEQIQPVAAGYGYIRVGPVQTSCERNRPTLPCKCDAQDLAEAGGATFARPGLYRWRRGQLVWVSTR